MTAKDTYLTYCEERAFALEKQLRLTTAFIKREFELHRGISPETTQAMIDNYITSINDLTLQYNEK